MTAIGTDIFYAAVTKTVGGWRHLRMKTVNIGPHLLAGGRQRPRRRSRGVWVISILQSKIGEAELDSIVYALLGGTLLMVGIITLARALILSNLIEERDDFEIKRRHKVAAVVDRRDHRLRHRDHLGRLGHGDRDPADRDLPADPAEGRRHRRLPRRDPALGRRPRPLGRRQRRLRPRRQHPARLGARRDRRRRTSPAGRRPASCAPRSASSSSPRGSSPCRRATRWSGRSRRWSPASGSALLIWAPRWYQQRQREAAPAPHDAGSGADASRLADLTPEAIG